MVYAGLFLELYFKFPCTDKMVCEKFGDFEQVWIHVKRGDRDWISLPLFKTCLSFVSILEMSSNF